MQCGRACDCVRWVIWYGNSLHLACVTRGIKCEECRSGVDQVSIGVCARCFGAVQRERELVRRKRKKGGRRVMFDVCGEELR